MKTRKSITLKIPLPPNGGAIENSVGFKRFLAEAATKLLSQSCNEVWVRDKYVLFLKAEERRRRQAFQNRVAELKAGKPAASVATPASSSAPTVNVPPRQRAAGSRQQQESACGHNRKGWEWPCLRKRHPSATGSKSS